jgi:hypothetical protein
MTEAAIFDIIAERIADYRKSGDSFHVRRFSDCADAERYLDELVVRFKGNKARDEQGERPYCLIRRCSQTWMPLPR